MKETKFDQWAKNYEKDINLLKDQYPFAGYFDIIEVIKKKISEENLKNILDLGIGSGYMLSKVTDENQKCIGIDFSEKMLEIAGSKFKSKNLIRYDISKGIPDELKEERFDCILSAYTLHHFNQKEKIEIIKSYSELINKGCFIIADIAFDSIDKMLIVKMDKNKNWDVEEEGGYIIFDSFSECLEENNIKYEYKKMSYCSGIFIIEIQNNKMIKD